jgi:hypothetical protein
MYALATTGEFLGRTKEFCRNIKFIGGTIRRHHGVAARFNQVVDTTWEGVEFIGNYIGAYFQYRHMSPTEGVSHTGTGLDIRRHRFIGCDFRFNEATGVLALDLNDSTFDACRASNNGQGMTFGGRRSNGAAVTSTSGFGTATGTAKTGLAWVGACQADDTQGGTFAGFPDPSRPTVIGVDQAERYGVGQTVTITGAGAGGANLLTRINDINHDELTLQHPIVTFPTVTLAGTIAVSGTAVTGSGTAFLTDLVGRAFIKVGADYRRVVRVASNTSATLAAAFPANVPAGTAFTIVRASIVTTACQQYGYVFNTDVVDPVLMGGTAAGNTVGGVRDLAPGAARAITAPNFGTDVTITAPAGTAAGVQAAGPSASHSLALKPKGASGVVEVHTVTGSQPVIQAAGPDANHTLSLRAKGTSAVVLRGGDNQAALWVQSATGAKNYLDLRTGEVGSPVVMLATSSDPAETDVNLDIRTRNAGVLMADGTQVEVKGHTHTVAQVAGAAAWVAAPATPTSPGTLNQIARGQIAGVDHLFVCTAANVWKAVALNVTTWP